MREGYAKGQYVQLYYFKPGGKFYTSGQVIVPRDGFMQEDVWDEVKARQRDGRLPGLSPGGGQDFTVLVCTTDLRLLPAVTSGGDWAERAAAEIDREVRTGGRADVVHITALRAIRRYAPDVRYLSDYLAEAIDAAGEVVLALSPGHAAERTVARLIALLGRARGLCS